MVRRGPIGHGLASLLLLSAIAVDSAAQEAGFVVRMQGAWTQGPTPGTPLTVGEVVQGGALIDPPPGGGSIEIALYHEPGPLRGTCGAGVGCARLEVPRPEGPPPPAERILRAVQSLFLERPRELEYAAARDTSSSVELQSTVLVNRDGGFVASPALSAAGSDGTRVTFRARGIDERGRLMALDPRLSITVERRDGAEHLTVKGVLEPGLYDVWDEKGEDERPPGVPATLGTWVLVASGEGASAVQEEFKKAEEAIRWDPEFARTRTVVLRAYLLVLRQRR